MSAACVERTAGNQTQTKLPKAKPLPRSISVARRNGSTTPRRGRISPPRPAADAQKMPEKELLQKYRHVYAGRGGWYGYRNGPHGPVNQASRTQLRYMDKYKKEILFKLSKTLQKCEDKKMCEIDGINTAGRVCGVDISEQETDPDRSHDCQIKNTRDVSVDRAVAGPASDGDVPDVNVCQDGVLNTQSTEPVPECGNQVLDRLGDQGPCIIANNVTLTKVSWEKAPDSTTGTKSTRPITVTGNDTPTVGIGTYEKRRIDKSDNKENAEAVSECIQRSPLDNHEAQDPGNGHLEESSQQVANVHRSDIQRSVPGYAASSTPVSSPDNREVIVNVADKNTHPEADFHTGAITTRSENTGLKAVRSRPSVLDRGGTQTARNGVESHTEHPPRPRLKSSRNPKPGWGGREKEGAGFGLYRDRLDVFSRMSREARWARNATRREMGLDDDEDDAQGTIEQHSNHRKVDSRHRETDDFDTDNKSGSNRTEVDDTSYHDDLDGEVEQENVNSVVTTCSASNQQQQRQQRGAAMSVALAETTTGVPKFQTRERQLGHPSTQRKLRHQKIRAGVMVNQTRETAIISTDLTQSHLQQQQAQQQQQQQCSRKSRRHSRTSQSQSQCRPLTKLPEIKVNCTECKDSVADLPSRGAKGNHGMRNYRVLPVTRVRREGTFEITPPGYDCRFRNAQSGLDEVPDETPVEVKARATEKCIEWMNKYWQ